MLLQKIEDEAAHISMIGGPLGVLGIGATGSWWWMEVWSRIVRVLMSIPTTLPGLVLSNLLIVNVEVVVCEPVNLKTRDGLTRVVVSRQFDVEVQFSVLDDLCGVSETTPCESRTYPIHHSPIYRCRTPTVVHRHHR